VIAVADDERIAAKPFGRHVKFVPDAIASRSFPLDGDASVTLHRATKSLERLQHTPTRIATLGAVAQNLLRSESVASSRIEGVLISHKRLARAAHQGPGRQRMDNRAAEVLGNVEAMGRAIELGAEARPITVSDLLEIHRLLLHPTEDRENVPDLLEDLCQFAERDDLPPIVQAAIAHAQFETIHPFADGNGRTGRALVYAILRRRGEVTSYIPPISLVLVGTPEAYIGGLTAYRKGDVSEWCDSFAAATAQAAVEAERLAQSIEALEEKWLDRAGNPREGSAARRLIGALPERPVIDVAGAARLSGRSRVAASAALERLEEAGIVRRLNERKWGRLWECDELLELVEDFEASVRRPASAP
jgi:Fic family protein